MPANGFDLAAAAAVVAREDAGILVPLNDEAGEPLTFGPDAKPVTITVAGAYSSLYRRTLDAQRVRMQTSRKATWTSDDARRNQLELLATCVLSWEGFFEHGDPFTCTKENALRLLELAPWIRQQVEEAVVDHQGFSRSSPAR